MVDSVLAVNLGGTCQSKAELIKLARQHNIDTGHGSMCVYNQYDDRGGLLLIVGLQFVCEEELVYPAHHGSCGRRWACSLEDWGKPYDNPYHVCNELNHIA